MHEDLEIFRAAHEGDFGPLIALLRSGAKVTPERRALIIKILDGELKRPPHRQRSMRTPQRRRAIAKRVREIEHEGCTPMRAVARAQKEFKCSEATVRSALRDERKEGELHTKQEEFIRHLHHLAVTASRRGLTIYPGVMSPDSVGQFHQARSGQTLGSVASPR
jgi:hypothetical protein